MRRRGSTPEQKTGLEQFQILVKMVQAGKNIETNPQKPSNVSKAAGVEYYSK